MSWKGEVGCVGVLRAGREQGVSDRHPYKGQAGVARSGRKLLELLLLGTCTLQSAVSPGSFLLPLST